MGDFNQALYFEKYRNLKCRLLILLPLLGAACIVGMISSSSIMNGIGFLSIFLLFIDIGVVIALFTEKYYNWILFFLVLVIIAIVFRHQRWPLASALFTFGFGGLGSVSIFSSVIYLKRYPGNPFLKYIGFFSSVVLFIVSMGLLWKNQHWPQAGVFINVGLITFIAFLFAFVFILPNANFMNWTKHERIVFFRVIIIPMIFVYTLCVMMFVFPEFWTALLRSSLTPFGMGDFDLLDKAGIH
jgi:hypothetical protein